MSRKLKVYGWIRSRHDCPPAANGSRQSREIMCAPSMAAVRRACGYKPSDTWNICETGNDVEVAVASAEPLVLFWSPLDCKNFQRATEMPRQ